MASLRTMHEELPVKIRNISSGGAMIECMLAIEVEESVSIQVRNVGWVEGVIVWRNDNKYGVKFSKAIDPQSARVTVKSSDSAQRITLSGTVLRRI